VPLAQVLSLGVREELARMKIIKVEEFEEASAKINEKIDRDFDQLVIGEMGGESQ
jgi:hypothetical protein